MTDVSISNTTMINGPYLALGTVDYVVIVIMLLISSGIGVYFRFSGGKQRTTHEFLMAGRDMAILPVAFSVMATGKSAVTYLGTASEMYVFGTHYAFNILGISVGALAAAYLFLPVYFNTGVCTTYEYLERRYGRFLRMFCSFTFCLQSMLYIGVILYAPALALSAVTHFSIWSSVIAVGVVCTFYCTLGGMKAVLWTDVFQAILMYGSLLVLVIKGCIDVGGIRTVISRAYDGGRLLFPGFDMNFETRYTFINIFLNGFFLGLSSFGATQMQVQRLLTVRSVQRARCVLFTNIPMTFVFHALMCFAGLVIYANFYKCDPLTSPERNITKRDQLLPYFSLITFGQIPGLPGLCVCGILSASLSTMSSIVNSLTTVSVEDFIRPFCALRGITEARATLIAKVITLIYGFAGLLLTYIVASFGNVLQAGIIVYGLVAGPTLGVFLLGVLTSRTNEKGAVMGLVISLVFTAWISFGGSSTNVAHRKLPVSTVDCPVINSTVSNVFTHNHTDFTTFPSTDFTTFPSTDFTTFPSTDFTTFLSIDKLADLVTETSSVEDTRKKYVFPLYRISYMWFMPIGVITTVVFGYISSFLFSKTAELENHLLSPIVTKITIKKTPKEETGIEITSCTVKPEENEDG